MATHGLPSGHIQESSSISLLSSPNTRVPSTMHGPAPLGLQRVVSSLPLSSISPFLFLFLPLSLSISSFSLSISSFSLLQRPNRGHFDHQARRRLGSHASAKVHQKRPNSGGTASQPLRGHQQRRSTAHVGTATEQWKNAVPSHSHCGPWLPINSFWPSHRCGTLYSQHKQRDCWHTFSCKMTKL